MSRYFGQNDQKCVNIAKSTFLRQNSERHGGRATNYSGSGGWDPRKYIRKNTIIRFGLFSLKGLNWYCLKVSLEHLYKYKDVVN